jgi:hypothetical protein
LRSFKLEDNTSDDADDDFAAPHSESDGGTANES